MNLIDIKVFNVLIHYGKHDEFNLLDLLDQCLLENLLSGEPVDGTEYMYPDEVKQMKRGRKQFLEGYLYRSSTLKWKTVPNEERRHRTDPGKKRVLPSSRFFLDLEEHRLFWITERGLARSPSAFQFCSYIKRSSLPKLKEIFRNQAESDWIKGTNRKPKESFKKYLSRFYHENNLSNKTFKIILNPEVSTEKVNKILAAKHIIIKQATFFPNLNNATKRHVELLFTGVGKIASEAKSSSEIVFNPLEKKEGVAKPQMFTLLKTNDEEQILRFEFKLKDTRNSSSPMFKISNYSGDNSEKIQKTETLLDEINSQGLLTSVLLKFKDLKPRNISSAARAELKKRIRKLLT